MKNAVAKVTSQNNQRVIITERGTSFGYNNLVVDFRGLPLMRGFGYPVVPKGQARLRVQVSAALEEVHLQQALDAFAKL